MGFSVSCSKTLHRDRCLLPWDFKSDHHSLTMLHCVFLFVSSDLACLTTAKPPLSSPALHQAKHRKRNRRQTSSSSSSSHPHPGPPSILLSDTTMTPWGGLALSEPSFTSIPPRPPAPPPPPPPAPQPTPSTPYRGRQNAELEEVSSSSFNSEVPSPPAAVHQDSAGMAGTRARVMTK